MCVGYEFGYVNVGYEFGYVNVGYVCICMCV